MKNSLLIVFVFSQLLSCKLGQEQSKEPRGERPSLTQLISEMDSDKNGKLSKEEVRGPLAHEFSAIDTDKDGFLTETELEKAPRPEPRAQGGGPLRENDANKDLSKEVNTSVKTIPVNKAYFISENIIGDIQEEIMDLNGVKTLCYIIKTHSRATEHQMGPWCPRHLDDGADKGGLWFSDGKVYDVSGHFIANLDEFYSDDKWKLYRENGTIRVTETEEGCLAAAKPNVEEEYNNYCVECLPEYFKDQVTTFVIPVKPTYLNTTQSFGRNAIGVAFNGVKYDPPAPTDAILAAHTLAPLDDHGGHVNPHGGYHYHAVTGSTKEVEQADMHASVIGYAIDGFSIYALEDKNGNTPKDLDECGGHMDTTRGYHYHAGTPGGNQILKCLHGLPGYTELKE